MVSAAASLAFPAPNPMKTHKTEAMGMEGGVATPQDSRVRICVYCRKGFESSKALYGHLRIHRQARPETEILRINSPKRETERSVEEDGDDGFRCFACNESFVSMQLLCRHMRTHGGSRARQRPATSQESNSNHLSEAETTLSNGHNIDLLKDMPNWSQTKKRGSNVIASDDDIIYNAVPLRFCLGPEHPLMQEKKKKKIEESLAYQDTLMEGAADSESTVLLLDNCVTTMKKLETRNKSRSGHGRRSIKKDMAQKGVHQCEICGKTFSTGQALGGHKTFHRVKDPSKAELVHAKTRRGSCVTRMVLPVSLPEQAPLSEEARPKKMLDLDLNIPYQENLFPL